MNDHIIIPRASGFTRATTDIANDPRFIPDDPVKKRRKTVIILTLIFLGIAGSYFVWSILKKPAPIADIRQFATAPLSTPPQSFTNLALPPSAPPIIPTEVIPTSIPTRVVARVQQRTPTARPRASATATAAPTQRPAQQTQTVSYQCQQILLYRDGEDLTLSPDKIRFGDTVHFLAYVPNTGSVKSITFGLDINGANVSDTDVVVGLHDNAWVADFVHVFSQAGTHRVYIKKITSL